MTGGFVCAMHGGRAPQVRAKAAQRVADMLADAIDPNRVLREAGRLAYSDIRKLYDEQGRLLPIRQWPDDIAAAVASIETARGNVDKGDGQFDQVTRIRLWDKPSKLANLMKHHGQLADKLEVSVTGTIEARLVHGRKRLAAAKRG
jgi:phage terminase small subunit